MKLEKSRGSTNFRRLLQQHYIFYQNQSWHSYSNCMTKLNWLIWKSDFMNRSIQVTQSNKWPIGQGSESNILLYSMINDISINSGLIILGLTMVSNEPLSLSARQMIFLFANYLNIVNRKKICSSSLKSPYSLACVLYRKARSFQAMIARLSLVTLVGQSFFPIIISINAIWYK